MMRAMPTQNINVRTRGHVERGHVPRHLPNMLTLHDLRQSTPNVRREHGTLLVFAI